MFDQKQEKLHKDPKSFISFNRMEKEKFKTEATGFKIGEAKDPWVVNMVHATRQ